MRSNVAIPYFRPAGDITIVAAAALTGKRFARFATGGTGTQPLGDTAAAGEHAAGVIAHDVEYGYPVHLLVAGVVPVTAGAAITANDQVSVGEDGRAVPATEASDTADASTVVGIAIASADSGSDAPVLLN